MRNPAMNRVEKWLKLSVLPPIGARGDSRAGAVDADGFAGPRAGGCACIVRTAYHPRILARAAAHGPYRHIVEQGRNVLISQHQDGEIIARIISRFGHRGGPWIEHQRWGACLARS